MKIESYPTRWFQNKLTRQFKLRLYNDNLYILSMSLTGNTDDRTLYSYTLYDGNRFIFKSWESSEYSTPIAWEILGLASAHCLLDFLTTVNEYTTIIDKQWLDSDDCNDIRNYLSEQE